MSREFAEARAQLATNQGREVQAFNAGVEAAAHLYDGMIKPFNEVAPTIRSLKRPASDPPGLTNPADCGRLN